MKKKLLIIIAVITIHSGYSIELTGKIIEKENQAGLAYANIGIINSTIGSISNEEGIFVLNIPENSDSSIIKFSMIGYKPQEFSIANLSKKDYIIIELESKPIALSEIIISNNKVVKNIGLTKAPINAGICGWGGTQFGQGHEIGTKISLGKSGVKILSMHMNLYKQSFDSSLFRIHIRSITDNVPQGELLNTNIYAMVTKEKGWIDINLSNYNILLKDEVAISLEWVETYAINENKLIKMNGSKTPTPNVLFKTSKKEGVFYKKRGCEAEWTVYENQPPVFYVKIQE